MPNTNNSELLEKIEKCVTNAVKRAISGDFEVEKPETQLTPLKRTEELLSIFPNLNKIVSDKLEQIDTILEYGLPQKSPSIMEYHASTGKISRLTLEEETIESVVGALQCDIVFVNNIINRVMIALNTVKDERDYDILTGYYFDGKTLDTLSEQFGVDKTTILRRKNALVKKVCEQLFPKEAFGNVFDNMI